MKRLLVCFLLVWFVMPSSFAQKNQKTKNASTSAYGDALNIGLGINNYGFYSGTPMLMLNYEFDVAKNFTIAPFVGIYAASGRYYWGNPSKPFGDPSYKYYSYNELSIPIGAKGTYYFDEILNAGSKWDFYGAGSLGFVYRRVSWENGYLGNTLAYSNARSLHLDLHIGTEYRINSKYGMFLDLSTGVSTIGLAVHLK